MVNDAPNITTIRKQIKMFEENNSTMDKTIAVIGSQRIRNAGICMWSCDVGSRNNWPFIFFDERNSTVTVNSARYVEMLDHFLVAALQNIRGKNRRTWCKQYGTKSLPFCHQVLKFSSWGYPISAVYVNILAHLVRFIENIRSFVRIKSLKFVF